MVPSQDLNPRPVNHKSDALPVALLPDLVLCYSDVIKKAVEKAASSRHNTVQLKVDNPLVSSTCQACSVYLTAMETLTQLRLNIVTGMM